MSNTLHSSAGKRIEALLDRNSFVEIGGRMTARNTDFNLQSNKAPSDGVITGYGIIDGNLVYIYAQDRDVLNGTIGEVHAKKIMAVYDLAIKTGAPVIGLLDCAGLRLQEASDALQGLGGMYSKQVMASGLIPQITAIFGSCGGGLAIVPGLTDFTFMECTQAKLFVNSQNTLSGNAIENCDNTSAGFQTKESGLVDFAGSESEIFRQIRTLITLLPSNNEDNLSYDTCTDDLNRICTGVREKAEDPAQVLSMMSDEFQFMEMKACYAEEMVTGFIRLNGMTIGAVGNRTIKYEEGAAVKIFDAVLTPDGCEKAAAFVRFCDAFGIPLLTLTNVKGYQTECKAEKRMAQAAARLTHELIHATVPKVNVITGHAIGSATLAMNSKSTGADLVYAWADTKMGIMDAAMAVRIIYAEEINNSPDGKSLIQEKAKDFDQLQSGLETAAARGQVDDIILPEDTRKYMIGAFEMLFTKKESHPNKKHGAV